MKYRRSYLSGYSRVSGDRGWGCSVCARTTTVALVLALIGCAGTDQVESEGDGVTPGFEAFESSCQRESGTGAYLVEGDIAIWSKEALQDYYQSTLGQVVSQDDEGSGPGRVQQPLAVYSVNGADVRWSSALQRNLTYCVSSTFGANKSAVVSAMASATSAWSAVANVRFVYSSAQDASCTASNNNVVFDVRPTSGQDYLARSFFPNYSRSKRNIMIDSSAYSSSYSLAGILRHELGHVLGFRHEHSVGGTNCYEDQEWRSLTAYDSASVMHYPQCGGSGGSSLSLTTKDKNGAACLYGAATGYVRDCSYRGVVYRAHAEGIGWMPEVFSGNIAGTVGQSRRVEAVRLRMSGVAAVGVCYTGHVQGIGWQSEVCNGADAGTTGQSRRLEAIKVRLTGAPAGCNVVYRAHVAGVGWQSGVSNNAIAGTVGQSRAIEALEVWTTGSCGF